jgi:uncharacterized membrane protein
MNSLLSRGCRTPLVASLAAALSSAAFGQASFLALGTLAGQTTSTARGLSGDGSIVIASAGTTKGFRWTAAGGVQDLGAIAPSTSNTPVAIAANGSRIVGTSSARGYAWTEAAGIQDLGTLPATTTNVPGGISGDGGVVVGSCSAHGYTWTPAGGLVDIPPPDDRSVSMRAVSFDGTTALGVLAGRSPYPLVRVRAGQVDLLPLLPGGLLGASASAISIDGEVIAGRCTTATGNPPAIWTGNATVTTPAPETYWAVATAMSSDGSVIVGTLPGTNSFVVRSGQLQVLSSPDTLQLTGISADGQIAVGTAQRGSPLVSEAVILVNDQVLWLKDELQAQSVDVSSWASASSSFISRDGTAYCGTGVVGGVTQAWRAVRPRP